MSPASSSFPAYGNRKASFEKSKNRFALNFDIARDHRYTGRGFDYNLVRKIEQKAFRRCLGHVQRLGS
jgi:hypothetical protein